MEKKPKILVSGGGTAGHIYPALAVADALTARGCEVKFVGALGKMEMERVPLNGYPIDGLPVVGIRRSFSLAALASNLAFPFRLWRSVRLARAILLRERPVAVVGFGGYASAPIVRAAQRMGIPTMLQEQNSYAGLANRMLGKRARKVFTAYEGMDRFFDPKKIVLTGNPLRCNMLQDISREEALAHFGLDPSRRTILVTGGSLGTRTLNEMVLQNPINDADVQVIWQTGKIYIAEMEQRVREVGLEVSRYRVMPFIERMDMAYAAADVVVCRAGASTVSELQLRSKAVVFIPSPAVAEDHQTKNAMALSGTGAAVLVSDDQAVERGLVEALGLLGDDVRREAMASKLGAMGRGGAADRVAELVLGVIDPA